MGESREVLLVSTDRCYVDSVEHAIEAYDTSNNDPIRAALAAAVEMAETDPEGARAALWRMQGDWQTLERLQERIGGEPTRAALRVGGAIQLARSELASPAPQLDRVMTEIMAWLDTGQMPPQRAWPDHSGESPKLVAEEIKRHRDGDGDRLRGELAD